jgi:hypothetical protein
MYPPEQPSLKVVVDINVLVRGTLSATGGSALIIWYTSPSFWLI